MKKTYTSPEIEIIEFDGEAQMTMTLSGVESEFGDNDIDSTIGGWE